MANTIKIYVQLLGYEKGIMHPTQAIDLGNGLYEVLADKGYDPEDSIWEFPPGSTVRLKKGIHENMEHLFAIKP